MRHSSIVSIAILILCVVSTLPASLPQSFVQAQQEPAYNLELTFDRDFYYLKGDIIHVSALSNVTVDVTLSVYRNGTELVYEKTRATNASWNIPTDEANPDHYMFVASTTERSVTVWRTLLNTEDYVPASLPFSYVWKGVNYTLQGRTFRAETEDDYAEITYPKIPFEHRTRFYHNNMTFVVRLDNQSRGWAVDIVYATVYAGLKWIINGTLDNPVTFDMQLAHNPLQNWKRMLDQFKSTSYLTMDWSDLRKVGHAFTWDSSTNTLHVEIPSSFSIDPYIFESKFETGDFSEWDGTVTTTGETASVVSTDPHHGTYHADFTTDGSGSGEKAFAYKAISPTEPTLYTLQYVKFLTALPSSGERYYVGYYKPDNLFYLRVWNDGGTLKWELNYRKNGGAATLTSTTPTIALNTWYGIKLYCNVDNSAGAVEVWFDGVSKISDSGFDNSDLGDINQIRVGEIYGSPSAHSIYVDCVYVDSSDIPEEEVGDLTPPTYSNVGVNTTIAGTPALLYAKWTDADSNMSGYIFGTNNTGSWANETWSGWSGSNQVEWSNVTKTLNSTPYLRVEWRIWANDTASPCNWNNTGIQYFTTTETTSPYWSNAGTNTTLANTPCLFYVYWTNIQLEGFIFGTNNTGSWTNDTWTDPWAGKPTTGWSNVTKTLTVTVGVRVEWTVWVNDTSGNWNNTGTQYLITSGYYTFDLTVYFENGTLIESANVTMTETTELFNVQTNSSGQIATQTLESSHRESFTLRVFKQGVRLYKSVFPIKKNLDLIATLTPREWDSALDGITYSSNIITVVGFNQTVPCDAQDICDVNDAEGWEEFDALGTNEFYSHARIQFGDGSTPTYFNASAAIITFSDDALTSALQYYIKVRANAHVNLGKLINASEKVTREGVVIQTLESTFAQEVIDVDEGGSINLYGFVFIGAVATQRAEFDLRNGSIYNSWFTSPSQITINIRDIDAYNSVISSNGTVYAEGWRPWGTNTMDKIEVYNGFIGVTLIGGGATITNVELKGCAYSFYLDARFNNYIINGDVDDWSIYDWYLTGDGITYEQYTFDIIVAFPNQTRVNNANVTLHDVNETLLFHLHTNSSGQIPTQTVTYETFTDDDGETPTIYTPHILTVFREGFRPYRSYFNISEKTELVITVTPRAWATGTGNITYSAGVISVSGFNQSVPCMYQDIVDEADDQGWYVGLDYVADGIGVQGFIVRANVRILDGWFVSYNEHVEFTSGHTLRVDPDAVYLMGTITDAGTPLNGSSLYLNGAATDIIVYGNFTAYQSSIQCTEMYYYPQGNGTLKYVFLQFETYLYVRSSLVMLDTVTIKGGIAVGATPTQRWNDIKIGSHTSPIYISQQVDKEFTIYDLDWADTTFDVSYYAIGIYDCINVTLHLQDSTTATTFDVLAFFAEIYDLWVYNEKTFNLNVTFANGTAINGANVLIYDTDSLVANVTTYANGSTAEQILPVSMAYYDGNSWAWTYYNNYNITISYGNLSYTKTFTLYDKVNWEIALTEAGVVTEAVDTTMYILIGALLFSPIMLAIALRKKVNLNNPKRRS